VGKRLLVTRHPLAIPLAATQIIPFAEGENMLGTVKWFSSRDGYGFIVPDDGGRDVFVHYKAIDADGFRDLAEGDRVRFQVVQTQKGPQARQVRVASEVAVRPEGDDGLPLPQYVDWRVG
jgi:CspA family cold shock protein